MDSATRMKLGANAIGSPLTNEAISFSEHLMWRFRQRRSRVVSPRADAMAKMHDELFVTETTVGPGQHSIFFEAECYFAKFVLFEQIAELEAQCRQLAQVHIQAWPEQPSKIINDLLRESPNPIECTFALVGELTNDVIPGAKDFLEKFNRTFVKPLLCVRNAIVHGKARDYLANGKKKLNHDFSDADKRALSILNYIDAPTCFALCMNLAMLRQVTYMWLLVSSANEVVNNINGILAQENNSIRICGGTMDNPNIQLFYNFANTIPDDTNGQGMRDACLMPPLIWTEFLAKQVST